MKDDVSKHHEQSLEFSYLQILQISPKPQVSYISILEALLICYVFNSHRLKILHIFGKKSRAHISTPPIISQANFASIPTLKMLLFLKSLLPFMMFLNKSRRSANVMILVLPTLSTVFAIIPPHSLLLSLKTPHPFSHNAFLNSPRLFTSTQVPFFFIR